MILEKKNAIRIFYYLLAIDDSIEDEELSELDMIGNELDGEAYNSYKNELIEECAKTVRESDADELYDMLSEKVDKACTSLTVGSDAGIPSRLLVWDMLAIAYSNKKYDETEKRLIHHVARTCGIDKSLVLEMESHIQNMLSVEKHLDFYQKTSLPYSKIRPIVDELESRKNTIKKCITELISDELYEIVEKVDVKDDFVDKMKAYCAEKTAPAIDNSKKAIGKAWTGLKSKIKSATDNKNGGKEQQ